MMTIPVGRYNGAMSRVPVDRKTDQVIVRLSKAQKARWQREADRQNIKLSELIRYVTETYCDKRKTPKK